MSPKEKLLFESYRILTKRIKKKYFIPKPYVMESLFFPSIQNEQTLFSYIEQAKKTLDICMYIITSNKLINLIEKAKQK